MLLLTVLLLAANPATPCFNQAYWKPYGAESQISLPDISKQIPFQKNYFYFFHEVKYEQLTPGTTPCKKT